MRKMYIGGIAMGLFVACVADGSEQTLINDATLPPPDQTVNRGTGCKVGAGDQFALVMLQQRYMGFGTQLPTTTRVPAPTTGGWTTYTPRVFPNAQPAQARGYLIDACHVHGNLHQRVIGEGLFSYAFWHLSISHILDGAYGSGLLSAYWERRGEAAYALTQLTAGVTGEIREGSVAATTVGEVSVRDALGRTTTFEETWWFMCVPRGQSPNDVRLPDAWRPVTWGEGNVARCYNEGE